MNVPASCPPGYSSLTAFVEAHREQNTHFATEYRQYAMAALDSVEESLCNQGKGKHAASTTLADLASSLHAVRDTAVRTRDENLQAARRAATESSQTRVFTSGDVVRPLAAARTQTAIGALIRPDSPLATQDPILRPGLQHRHIVQATLTYGHEYVVVHDKPGRGQYAGSMDYWNMSKTLQLVDEMTPFVRTVLAHPAFANEEEVQVHEESTDTHASAEAVDRSGLFHRREAVVASSADTHSDTVTVHDEPLLQQALTQLQTLRGIISAMRVIPGNTVTVSVDRQISEDATVRNNPFFGTPTEEHTTPYLNYSSKYKKEYYGCENTLVEQRSTYAIPAAPDHICMS